MPPSLRVRTMISLADEITFKLYIVPPPTYNSANIVFAPPFPRAQDKNPPAMITLAVLSCMSNQIYMNYYYYYYSYEHLLINISTVV